VKNDHLGFGVLYVFKGVVHKYRPDFVIRLKTEKVLVTEQGGFGNWSWAVSKQPGDVVGILEQIL
jgi:type III restriction enzyme